METAGFTALQSERNSLPDRVSEMISRLIIERQLKAGDRIPNEFELAQLLNVGRGTIREAVKLLVSRNILEIRRGVGTFVANTPGRIEDPLGFAYYPDQPRLIRDLLEVRKQLEPWVARMAALRATEENLCQVRSLCRQVEDDILSGRDHLPHDEAFHTEIADCTQNVVVSSLLPIISYSVGLFGTLTGKRLLSDTIKCHRAIADAICDRNPDMAEKMMRRHLEQNQEELERVILAMEEKT